MSPCVWSFPLPRPHTGVPLGNGRLGLLLWGGGRSLHLTVGRADWWDHRGGKPWGTHLTFATIRRLLEQGDEPALRTLFAEPDAPGQPRRPTLLPVGRFLLTLPDGHCWRQTALHWEDGRVEVTAAGPDDATHTLVVTLPMDGRPLAAARIQSGTTPPPALTVTGVPAWTQPVVHAALAAVGYEPPERLPATADSAGWTQRTPADAETTALVQRQGDTWWFAVALADHGSAALARELLAAAAVVGPDTLVASTAAWWRDYWQRVPRIEHPHPSAAFLYRYGLYKFAGLTHPAGVAAGLQGAWLEDDSLPPWSGDYHFNINVQMCYWPAYQTGLWNHLEPLFALVESWLPTLRENARRFAGVEGGVLLPHAVDDRCAIVGNFWTGTIDHACTAWVGKMMFDHWRYTGDHVRLRRVTFPYLVGTLRVYRAMMETAADGSLALPVSVSPEYRGAAMNAWGRNASFQLAACHWLVEALPQAAAALGEPVDPAWAEVREHLPKAALVNGPTGAEIGLWDDLLLEESHRHHSHLAGLCPFDTIDPHDPAWSDTAWRSHDRWVAKGMGLWSGWCMPWAAMLQQRFDNPWAAELLLDIWQRVFTNEGHGTLHDVRFPGFSLLGSRRPGVPPTHEIMQMDAGMAAAAAVLDGLAHTRRGVLHLFTGVPPERGACRFEGIWIEGGFRLDAARAPDGAISLRVTATRPGRLTVARGPEHVELSFDAGQTHELAWPGFPRRP